MCCLEAIDRYWKQLFSQENARVRTRTVMMSSLTTKTSRAVKMKRCQALILVRVTLQSYRLCSKTLMQYQALHPPDFIYECQKTLHEIDNVLKRFQHTTIKKSRFKVTKYRRMEQKNLIWPLRKSDTMRLIEALERHKSTCTLALAGNGLTGIHTILEQTKFSNKCLTNLMAKQEKLFELNTTHEQGV